MTTDEKLDGLIRLQKENNEILLHQQHALKGMIMAIEVLGNILCEKSQETKND